MRNNFEKFFEGVLDVEGGYVNDPDDNGGATNYGITLRVYNYYSRVDVTEEDLKVIPLAMVKDIYKIGYWDVMGGDDLPSGIDMMVCDFGVNSGPRTAIKTLQEWVGAEADGFMGPNTLAAVNKTSVAQLLHLMFMARRDYYYDISHRGNNQKYYKGWINRLNHVYDISHELVY